MAETAIPSQETLNLVKPNKDDSDELAAYKLKTLGQLEAAHTSEVRGDVAAFAGPANSIGAGQ